MFRLAAVALFAFALFAPLTALGQETYTIKLKKHPQGSVTRENKVETNSEDVRAEDLKGNQLTGKKEETVQSYVYLQTVVARPDLKKKPTALKRAYEKATVKVGDQSTTLPYEGKTILIEEKDGAYRFRYENGDAITGDDAKWLEKEFKESTDSDEEMDAILLPKGPVGVNQPWKIKLPELAKHISKSSGMTLDVEKGAGTGTLLKAYKKDGKQFGEMEFKIDVPVKGVKSPTGENIAFDPGATVSIVGKIDGCIDGSAEDSKSSLSLQVKGQASLPTPVNPQARLIVSVGVRAEGTSLDAQKK